MGGAYRCQTSQYNGFNVKPREALIQLVVQYPPTVEPVYTEIRQALGRAFSLTCRLLRAHPARLLRYEWKLGSRLLTVGQFSDQKDDTSYHVRALNREGYGEYTCDITNEAGAGRCTFLVTGKAYAPEFYYDTYGALWQNRPRVYGFKLQWTQMEPNAVDRILAYRLGIRQEIPMEGTIQKGELLTYNLTELIKPESYLVRLTPITRYGEGDATERIITYSGFYMYIETSRPRLQGDKARLLSPTFNMNTKTSSSSSSSSVSGPTYCFAFFYHMYGKHIGALNVFLRQKGQTVTDTSVWSLTDLRSLAPPSSPHIWQLCVTLSLALIGQQRLSDCEIQVTDVTWLVSAPGCQGDSWETFGSYKNKKKLFECDPPPPPPPAPVISPSYWPPPLLRSAVLYDRGRTITLCHDIKCLQTAGQSGMGTSGGDITDEDRRLLDVSEYAENLFLT
ncbi:hypothetical protein INR49_031445, partial [Caranx melampygus]